MDLTEEDWDEVLHVNLRALVFASQEFAKQNRGCSYGRIINIASTRAFMSELHSEAYAASKRGDRSVHTCACLIFGRRKYHS
ncbi:hypothetical protein GCM10020331_058400 [Ectobacillus funiculus]